jgi:hypothetical protein
MAAAQVGLSFEDLVERILHGARCHVPDFAAAKNS